MKEAFKLSEKAFSKDEVPIGAVVVLHDRIIGKGYNQVDSLGDPTAHAEILAITAAANTIGDWRLNKLHNLCNKRTLLNVCWCYCKF